jgi:glycerol uptake facilitator protein
MSPYLAELLGTLILVLLGDGVVANVALNKSKGQGGGWIVVTAGWAFAVAVAVYCVNRISGAHINPAVTVAMVAIKEFPVGQALGYIGAQMTGAFLGACLVWLAYLPHWRETQDQGTKLGVFATGPAIRNTASNLICEIIGTAVLVLGVLAILSPENLKADSGFDRGLGPALVGLLVWAIGLSLGGPTGYAINPARDLGPRLAHFVLPIPGKGPSDWAYSWIPIVGPLIGALIGAVLYQALWPADVVPTVTNP